MDVNKRITEIMNQKNITYYKLAKLSGLSQSTLTNLHVRGNMPTVYTLEQICKGLDISMGEFFMDKTENVYCLTEFQIEFMKWLMLLDDEQQLLVLEVIKNMVRA